MTNTARTASPSTATEYVNTLQLRSGDIVHYYGMRVLLGGRGEAVSRMEGLTTPLVVWFHGKVINAADLADDGIASRGLRTDTRCAECAPGEHWQIQGNERARWAREV